MWQNCKLTVRNIVLSGLTIRKLGKEKNMAKTNKNIVAEFLKALGKFSTVSGDVENKLHARGGVLWSYNVRLAWFEGEDKGVIWLNRHLVDNSPSVTTSRHFGLVKRMAKEAGFRLATK